MTTTMFIITSINKTLNLLWVMLVYICSGGDDSSLMSRSEVRHQRSLCWNTAADQQSSVWLDLRKILVDKKKHWVDFYHYRVVVYTHFQFKQLVKVHVALYDPYKLKIARHLLTACVLYIYKKN